MRQLNVTEIPTLRFSRKPFPSSRFYSKTSGFLFFSKTSQICYTYLKLSKNSNFKRQFVEAAKEIWKNCKNSRQVTFVADFTNDQTWSQCSRNSSCWAKKSQTLRQKATDPPLRTKSTRTCTTPRFLSLKVGMSDVNVTFASQGARKALYFIYSFLFQKYTRACIAGVLVFKTPCLLPSVKSGQTQFQTQSLLGYPSRRIERMRKTPWFCTFVFLLQKAIDVSYETEIEVNKMFVCLTKYKSYFAFLFL